MAHGRNRAVANELRTLFHLGVTVQEADGQLLERFTRRRGEGAELAFAALVERHGPMVWHACRGILRDDHEAQDAFQATFLILARRASALWVKRSLGPWLHRVACRVAVRARRAATRRRMAERKAAEAAEARGAGEAPGELARVVHEEIDRLPDRYRMAVILCDLEGRSYADAARHLGCPVGTIQSRLARGRERLRGRLTRRGLAPLCGPAMAMKGPAFAPPSALADATALAATRCTSRGAAIQGLVRPSVVLMLEKEIRAMVLTKLKAVAFLIGLGALLGGASLWAGQAEAPQRPRGDAGAVPPRLKFEIRTWKDGKERGEPIVIDASDEALTRIETEDASIEIRPKRPRPPAAEIQRDAELLSMTRQYYKEYQRALAVAKPADEAPPKLVLDGIRGTILSVDRSKNQATIALGSDDGLIGGQELSIYRNPADPRYVGRFVVVQTEPDRGMGRLTAAAPGIAAQRGDLVTVANVGAGRESWRLPPGGRRADPEGLDEAAPDYKVEPNPIRGNVKPRTPQEDVLFREAARIVSLARPVPVDRLRHYRALQQGDSYLHGWTAFVIDTARIPGGRKITLRVWPKAGSRGGSSWLEEYTWTNGVLDYVKGQDDPLSDSGSL